MKDAKEPENKLKCSATFTFIRLTRDSFVGSVYSSSHVDKLLAENEKHIEALNIIEEEYRIAANYVVSKAKGEDYCTYKLLGKDNDTINTFKQTERNPSQTEIDNAKKENKKAPKKIPLPVPIFRFKYPTVKTEEYLLIANKNFKTGKITPVVTDAKRNGVEFKLEIDGSIQSVRVDNVDQICTRMSVCTLTLTMNSICISGFGITLQQKIESLSLVRHDPIEGRETITEEDNDALKEFGDNNNESKTLDTAINSLAKSIGELKHGNVNSHESDGDGSNN